MAQIDPRLLQKIAAKKGITERAVYPLITEIVHETFLERDQAAVVLASRLHIPIQKYSTQSQREALRSYLGGQISRGHAPAPPPPPKKGAGPKTRASTRRPHKAKRPKDNKVFVIHGRDIALRDSMFAFLSALGCKPVEFKKAVAQVRGTGNPYIGTILDNVFKKANALIVLFSPDDEVRLKSQFLKKGERSTEGKMRSQARANVLFEAGMVMSRYQDKTVMVQVGELKSFSDIAGRHMVHLDDSEESRDDLVLRLEKLLAGIDRAGGAWKTAGNFKPKPGKKGRRAKG